MFLRIGKKDKRYKRAFEDKSQDRRLIPVDYYKGMSIKELMKNSDPQTK